MNHLRPAIIALLALSAALVIRQGSAAPGDSIESPDTGGDVGISTSLSLDASDFPVVSYRDRTNENLKVLHCNDPNCSGGDESITSPDTTGVVGSDSSLVLDASGNPVVSYHEGGAISDLKLLRCDDPNCSADESANSSSPDAAGDVGGYTSIALDASGYPVISYKDMLPDNDLKVLHCGNAACTSGNTIVRLDTAGDVGYWTSLVLDTSGNPVVSYFNLTDGRLKVLHCDDPNCSGGGESITSPDAAGESATSLALDAAGNPVVSYYDATNGDLKVLHCNDANCAGDESGNVASPDTGGDVGQYTSLALDAAGNPVVSYYDATNGDLKVLHCGNAGCVLAVGGVAAFPDTEEPVPQRSRSSGGGSFPYAVPVAVGLAAGAAVLAAGGWYARRRAR